MSEPERKPGEPSRKDYLIKAIEAFGRRLIVVDRDLKVLAATSRAGPSPSATEAGATCYDYLYDLPARCDESCPALEVFETGKPVSQRAFDTRKEEEICLFAYPIFEEGRVSAVAVVDVDLADLYGLEMDLRRSNAFLNNLLMSSVDGIIASDMRGKIVIFNEAAAEISGFSVEEAVGGLHITKVYPGDGAREIMRLLRSEEHGGRGKLKSYMVDCLRKDGSRVPIRLSASIVYEGEREMGSVGFFTDQREKLRMQHELQETQIKLLQAEKMASLGKLAAGVAHQLNNPLGGIMLYSQLLLEDCPPDDPARADLVRIAVDTERCRDIVRELLEFARQTRQEIRPCDINRTLSQTLFLLENQEIFQNIEIVKDLDEDLPQVPADVQQLNHVLMNIILNAAEAMEGQGRLIVRTARSDDGPWAVIRIRDTGCGIPVDVLPHIFEPFYTTKEEGKGTGLGLSMAYGIIENHKGRIAVESDYGRGSEFTIHLPFGEKEERG